MKILDVDVMHPRLQIVKVIDKIYKDGMTTTSGGNISICDANGDIWVTPSAVDKGTLTEKDIICVKKDGSIVGPHKPSSEFPFHKAIFACRPEIKAVIHAHPPALVSFSIVRKTPNTHIAPQAKRVCGTVGYAKYDLPGSNDLGTRIAAEFAKGDSMAVIMENHGLVLGGTDMLDAYTRFETLEFCAETILKAQDIGTPRYLANEELRTYDACMQQELPVLTHTEYPSDERALRSEICNLVLRACRQKLMISSFGTVSMRWRDNDFLITPTDKPRWDLSPEDIVQVRDGKAEGGKKPSRAALLHKRIYELHPNINSIIITQSPNLMAFACTDVKFDVRTIPESWIFLQDVPRVGFDPGLVVSDVVPNMLSADCPAVLLSNNGFLVTGDKLLQTFDRLEVAEFSAKSLVIGKSMGEMVPIGDVEIEALRKKFLA